MVTLPLKLNQLMLYEKICNYDEGFIKGIFEAYTEQEFNVIEINCCANGDKVCRFKIDLIKL